MLNTKLFFNITNVFSYICFYFSVILAFSAEFFDDTVLSCISICSDTISLILLRFSSYTIMKRTEQINLLWEYWG